MTGPQKMCMVRAGEGAQYVAEFRDQSMVAIGWGEAGSITKDISKDSLSAQIGRTWPEHNKYKLANAVGQIYRFLKELELGDWVITYDSSRRIYLVGTIQSDHRYVADIDPELRNQRGVVWHYEVDRDSLSLPTKNSLGAIQTLFQLPGSARDEILAIAEGKKPTTIDQAETELEDQEKLLKDLRGRSKEFIKDRLSGLDPYEMQELVAGLLRAMGYKTRVSPPGSDRGLDILASPDGFGLEQPRIVVKVKHRRDAIGSQEVRTFLGGRHKDDKGLYVSTGGFTKDARYEADRASIPLTLMDMDQLVEALLDHYESMDRETQVLLPLVKIYWPAT